MHGQFRYKYLENTNENLTIRATWVQFVRVIFTAIHKSYWVIVWQKTHNMTKEESMTILWRLIKWKTVLNFYCKNSYETTAKTMFGYHVLRNAGRSKISLVLFVNKFSRKLSEELKIAKLSMHAYKRALIIWPGPACWINVEPLCKEQTTAYNYFVSQAGPRLIYS